VIAILLAIAAQGFHLGGDQGIYSPAFNSSGPAVVIDAMPYARTVTCSDYTLTGSAPGAGAVSWSASPSGDSGVCTGTTSWTCVVNVDPDASGEGVETITVAQSGAASDTETIGFYVDGEHSCFLSQSVNGLYNSGLSNLDAVATWENLGSSALDVTQGTAGAQPTFRTSIVNGSPVVRCDGGDGLAAAAAADWTFLHDGNDNTIDSIALKSGTGGSSTIVANKTGTDGILGTRHSMLHTNLRFYRNVGTGLSSSNAVSANNAAGNDVFHSMVSWVDDDAGAGSDVFVSTDGVVVGAAGVVYSVLDASRLGVCFDGSGASALTGDLFRVLIYQSALDATQRGINKAVDEWALGGTLPVTP
jgi:hypothetical protein